MSEREAFAAEIQADPRWAAVRARDRTYDGRFFYAVRTTGVYCRPSCASRTARPENVVFFASAEDAERAGFRPCRRCRPDRPPLAREHAALVADLCRYIERVGHRPTLAELASRAGTSRFHLHRIFRAFTGLTPAAYAAAARARRLRQALAQSATVTDAIYAAGFNSSSRFYDASARTLGMTPMQYREGGAGTEIRYATCPCSLGTLLVAQSERGVCAISLGDDPEALAADLRQRFPRARVLADEARLREPLAAAVRFVEAPGTGLELPLDIRGSAFQQRVWEALRRIPPGSRVTYAELARRIGAPRAVRAVASACAANPIAVAIPCHRVVGSAGDLRGYRWGLERKRALLEREGSASTAPSRRRARSSGRR